MTERIKALLNLTLAGELEPKRTKVQYDRCDLFLPEDTMAAKRIYEYVTAQEPIITKYSKMTGLVAFDGSCPGDAMSVSGPSATAGCAECHLCVDNCPTGALRLLV